MRLRDLLHSLLPWIGLAVLVLAAGTFASYLDHDPSRLANFVWQKLNLRIEANAATWFESVLFLLCGASFALVGFAPKQRLSLPWWQRLFFQAMALACVFLSADEVASFHERIGMRLEESTGILEGSSVDGVGYSWVLIYGPALVAVIVAVRLTGMRLARRLAEPALRRQATRALSLAMIAAPMIVVLEAEDGFLVSRGATGSILPCFEETMELAALFGFLAGNTFLARGFEL